MGFDPRDGSIRELTPEAPLRRHEIGISARGLLPRDGNTAIAWPPVNDSEPRNRLSRIGAY